MTANQHSHLPKPEPYQRLSCADRWGGGEHGDGMAGYSYEKYRRQSGPSGWHQRFVRPRSWMVTAHGVEWTDREQMLMTFSRLPKI